MINVKNIMDNVQSKLNSKDEVPEIIKIDNLPVYDKEDYDLLDPKDFKKYIYDIEKTARTSFEYQLMVNYLRENMNMNECSFYENISNKDSFKIKIHLHHYPFTLFDIASIVVKKRMAYGEDLDPEMVAKEVMYLHYKLMVGLIPLSETVHELVHNAYKFIPVQNVFGSYQNFRNMYYDYMDPEMKDTLQLIEDYSSNNNGIIDQDVDLLSRHYIYVDPSGCYERPEFEEVISSLNERIHELNNKPDTTTLIMPIKILNE